MLTPRRMRNLIVSPTTEIAPFYYPRYEGKALFPSRNLSSSFALAHPLSYVEPWTKSGCSNTRPLPFRIGDR